MKIKDIKISKEFRKTLPKGAKMKECLSHYLETGKWDRDIVLGEDNVLIDGYVAYLIAKILDCEDVDVKIANAEIYCKEVKERKREAYKAKKRLLAFSALQNIGALDEKGNLVGAYKDILTRKGV